MTKIDAIIERATDGTYTVFCKSEIFSGAGTTIDQAKQDMLRQMAVYKETAQAAPILSDEVRDRLDELEQLDNIA